MIEFVVNTTDSLWFHCSQAGHCVSGMLFAINPQGLFSEYMQKATGPGYFTASPSFASVASSGSHAPSQAQSVLTAETGTPTKKSSASVPQVNRGLMLIVVGVIARWVI